MRRIDWVNTMWPPELIEQQKDTTNNLDDMKYPKVRKYDYFEAVLHFMYVLNLKCCSNLSCEIWICLLQGKGSVLYIPSCVEGFVFLQHNLVVCIQSMYTYQCDWVFKCFRMSIISSKRIRYNCIV